MVDVLIGVRLLIICEVLLKEALSQPSASNLTLFLQKKKPNY